MDMDMDGVDAGGAAGRARDGRMRVADADGDVLMRDVLRVVPDCDVAACREFLPGAARDPFPFLSAVTGVGRGVLGLMGRDRLPVFIRHLLAPGRGAGGGRAVAAAAAMVWDGRMSAHAAFLAADDLFLSRMPGVRSMSLADASDAAAGSVVEAMGALCRMRLCGLPPSFWLDVKGDDMRTREYHRHPAGLPLMMLDPAWSASCGGGRRDPWDGDGRMARFAEGASMLADAWDAVPSGHDWDEALRLACILAAGDRDAADGRVPVDDGGWARALPGVPAGDDPGVRRALLSILFALHIATVSGPYDEGDIVAARDLARDLVGMPVGFAVQSLGCLHGADGVPEGSGTGGCPRSVSVLTGVGEPAAGFVVGPAPGVPASAWRRAVGDVAERRGWSVALRAGDWLPAWSPVLAALGAGGAGMMTGMVRADAPGWAVSRARVRRGHGRGV